MAEKIVRPILTYADEAHHSPANTYQKVMEYFKPKLFLGMTATPDKRDDGDASKSVYELFHYQIAYEIRLQQAMEEDLLCPFHYFGINDISVITDKQMNARKISEEDFGKLTSDERVRHVVEQAKFYGYSGDRVKGLIFCSRNRECEELSAKFNALGYRTVALSGDNKDKERENAFERLAMNEEDATEDMQPLDYIFSVDILNESVDIVEVNQVIMLCPTQSPILSGVRPSELFILKMLLTKETIPVSEIQRDMRRVLDYKITDQEMNESIKVLQGCFTSKDEEYQKYKTIEIMDYDEKQGLRCFASYANCLLDREFNMQVKDIINVGLARYRDKYAGGKAEQTPFVLYEKYSRRDVSLLMNCGKDMSSTMYGMSRIGEDVFLFITYHKEEAEEGKNYADGKPDYADVFEDNLIFKWDSQIGKDNGSPYMQKVLTAPRKHLLVKKSDAESSFYYMGQFDIIESVDSQKEDNSGKMKPIAKVTMKMHYPVREDLLRYLQSNISKENKAV